MPLLQTSCRSGYTSTSSARPSHPCKSRSRVWTSLSRILGSIGGRWQSMSIGSATPDRFPEEDPRHGCLAEHLRRFGVSGRGPEQWVPGSEGNALPGRDGARPGVTPPLPSSDPPGRESISSAILSRAPPRSEGDLWPCQSYARRHPIRWWTADLPSRGLPLGRTA